MHDKSWGTSLFITMLHLLLRTEEAVFYNSAAQRHGASFVTFAILQCSCVWATRPNYKRDNSTFELFGKHGCNKNCIYFHCDNQLISPILKQTFSVEKL